MTTLFYSNSTNALKCTFILHNKSNLSNILQLNTKQLTTFVVCFCCRSAVAVCPGGPPGCPLPGPHLAGLQYHHPGPGADDQRYIGSKSWAYILVVIPSITGLGTTFFSVLNVPFFKKCNVLFHSVFEFLATYETQKNNAFFSVLFLRTE